MAGPCEFADSQPTGPPEQQHQKTPPTIPVATATSRYARKYFMGHANRGIAVIFNHEKFDNPKLPERTGTKHDCASLKKTFERLKFQVQVHNDLTWKEIRQQIDKISQHIDHTANDCLVICIPSHGDVGCISAKDVDYSLDTVLQCFTADMCPSLAGKPKLFFVQACRGRQLDDGVNLEHIETDSVGLSPALYKIPIHADFLIGYSTIPDHFSWRSTGKGGWYVQALCAELYKNGTTDDLLSMLTTVNRMVAVNFESNCPGERHGKKQMPCIVSMLTRLVYFSHDSGARRNSWLCCC